MPLIWAAISGHGYGHAAQVVPVLNALGSLVPDLTAILRTSVPASFFHDRLKIRWTMQSVQQDIGCIQQGPLQIDVAGTWDAHDRFHEQWQERLKKEVDALQAVRPRVILADTPYLAISAGWEVGIPAVGLANFLWNEVLEPLADSGLRRHHDLLADIRRCYGRAEHALRIAPGLPLTAVSGVTDIGPIAEPALPRRGAIRAHLGIAESERLVLVGFGGVALESLPWNAMAEMKGHCFIVDCEIPTRHPRMVAAADLPYPFKTLLASTDVVMTKPGYGTVVEAVAAGVPVVYVRRYNFADEQPLVDFLDRYGRACQLSREDFQAGRWKPALEAACSQDHPPHLPPPSTGAGDAATYLRKYF